MKKTLAACLIVSLAAFTGCDSKGTSGGPGTTNPDKKKIGKDDQTFSLTTSSMSIKQGEKADTTIAIKRGKNFDQDVTVTFDKLPEGVTVTPADSVIKHGDEDAKFKVEAKDDAALGDFKISVKGSPAEGAPATNELKLTVKKK